MISNSFIRQMDNESCFPPLLPTPPPPPQKKKIQIWQILRCGGTSLVLMRLSITSKKLFSLRTHELNIRLDDEITINTIPAKTKKKLSKIEMVRRRRQTKLCTGKSANRDTFFSENGSTYFCWSRDLNVLCRRTNRREIQNIFFCVCLIRYLNIHRVHIDRYLSISHSPSIPLYSI